MKLDIIVVGMYEVNCYLYWDEKDSSGIIIDPGTDSAKIIEAVAQIGFSPKAILLTHGHGDHIGAVRDLMSEYRIPLYAGKGEEELLSDSNANLSALLGLDLTTPPPDFLLADEDTVSIGSLFLKVFHTPGHSPGGVCYLDEKENVLFCGDTLFHGSIGRTDFPGCSTEKLLDSIQQKLLPLPDQIKCYPGHGPATTIGGERVNNPFLQGGKFV